MFSIINYYLKNKNTFWDDVMCVLYLQQWIDVAYNSLHLIEK